MFRRNTAPPAIDELTPLLLDFVYGQWSGNFIGSYISTTDIQKLWEFSRRPRAAAGQEVPETPNERTRLSFEFREDLWRVCQGLGIDLVDPVLRWQGAASQLTSETQPLHELAKRVLERMAVCEGSFTVQSLSNDPWHIAGAHALEALLKAPLLSDGWMVDVSLDASAGGMNLLQSDRRLQAAAAVTAFGRAVELFPNSSTGQANRWSGERTARLSAAANRLFRRKLPFRPLDLHAVLLALTEPSAPFAKMVSAHYGLFSNLPWGPLIQQLANLAKGADCPPQAAVAIIRLHELVSKSHNIVAPTVTSLLRDTAQVAVNHIPQIPSLETGITALPTSEVSSRTGASGSYDLQPVDPDENTLCLAREWINAYAAEPQGNEQGSSTRFVPQGPVGTAITQTDPLLQAAIAELAFTDYVGRDERGGGDQAYWLRSRLDNLAYQLVHRKAPIGPNGYVRMLLAAGRDRTAYHRASTYWIGWLLDCIEEYRRTQPLFPDLRLALAKIRQQSLETRDSRQHLRVSARILTLLEADNIVARVVEPDDGWGRAALTYVAQQPDSVQERLVALWELAKTAKGVQPSQRWQASAEKLIEPETGVDWTPHLLELFERFCRAASHPDARVPGIDVTPPLWLTVRNEAVLTGLVWCAGLLGDQRLTMPLARLVEAGYARLPGIGPRNAKVANAALTALARLPDGKGAAALLQLRHRLQHRSGQARLEAAIMQAAETAGLTVADLEELGVPTFDLVDGAWEQHFPEAVARLDVIDGREVRLSWRRADGRALKAAPAAVRREHKPDIQQLKALEANVRRSLNSQRDRLDGIVGRQPAWSLAEWQARYLEHPLVSLVARRLIWIVERPAERTALCWHEGRLVDVDDRPYTLTGDETVRPWHPALAPAAEVLAWRSWLERHQITQPFKQAHREIYLLTVAEQRTATYSNRFAAHLLRQHQFNNLTRARGWQYRLLTAYDGGPGIASRTIPGTGLTVEFWINDVRSDGESWTESGMLLFVATDQVRFRRDVDEALVPLLDVPPLVLSEAMRDVDLFVGVCAVGNDPTWADHGPRELHGYWRSFAFGDLAESAKTRRELLERLLPRLAIAGRCSLTDKFLVVRGDLRTYKIHLGSGNILMEPNDQYLCIVADRQVTTATDTTTMYLPFEGDGTLSVILSKAFLLASDRTITDPSITRQLH